MAVFKCKMCGANLPVDGKGLVVTCEYCRTPQTIPQCADEKIAQLFDQANDLRRFDEYDDALSVYQRILSLDPSNPEAHWGICLCRYGIEYVDDPNTKQKIPTCHRTSARLITEDADYRKALQGFDAEAARVIQAEANRIATIQKEIIAISQKEKPYDVFVCYKETGTDGERTQDSVLAFDIYKKLTDAGYRVFFSRVTLASVVGSKYEPYIYGALRTARAMLVVGTKPEHLNSPWVKNEWSRYLSFMKDRQVSTFFIPCYKGMPIRDLPKPFQPFQAIDFSKLGAMQDLLVGLEKMLGKKPPTITIQGGPAANAAGGVTAASLTKRALLLIADGDFDAAIKVVDSALNVDAEYGWAHYAKLLCDLRVTSDAGLEALDAPIDGQVSYRRAMNYGDEELRQRLAAINGNIKRRLDFEEKKRRYDHGLALMAAKQYAAAIEEFNAIIGFEDAKDRIEECTALRSQNIYDRAVSLLNRGTRNESESDLDEAEKLFTGLAAFLDSADKVRECQRRKEEVRIERIYRTWGSPDLARKNVGWLEQSIAALTPIASYKDSAARIENAKKRIREIKAHRRKMKKGFLIAGIAAAVAIAISVSTSLLFTQYVIPNSTYETGINLINDGNYAKALETLDGLGYSDSNAQVLVAKAGLAFEKGDYETGISRIYDAGGTVEIDYDADGGTTRQATPKDRPLRRSAYANATAEKPGYTFVEWKQQSFSISTKKDEHAAKVGLKASYEIVTYQVAYDLGGGSLDNPVTAYTVLATDIILGTPERKGYSFAGWSGTNLDGTQMAVTIPSGSVGDRNYVAHWVANDYKVNYDYGYGEKGSQTVTYDRDYSLENPTRPGYVFKGWKDGDAPFGSGTWKNDRDVELKADWEIVEYTITYELNGGTNSEKNPISYDVESEDIVLEDPVLKGHTFLGWTGGGYAEPTKAITIPKGSTGNRAYTAHWVANQYGITYDYGYGEKGSQTVAFGQDYSLEKPTRPGYVFKGWKYGGAPFTDGNWQDDYGIELKADWEIVNYAIAYELNDGINSENNPVSYNVESDDITLADPVLKGHTFLGWTGGEYAAPTKAITIPKGSTGNRAFTAHWVANEYVLTYDYGYGEKTGNQKVTFGQAYELVAPTRDGYDFSGWYFEDQKLESGTWIDDSDKTVLARWSAVQYDIAYNLNGGENDPSNPSVYTIEYPDIVLRNPSRIGYDFLGWSEGEGAPTLNAAIESGSTGNKTFTANWKAHAYSLNLDPRAGIVAYIQKDVDFDSAFELPTPTREGYSFAGWFDAQTGAEVKATTWTWANDLSLVAKWETVAFEITYVLNGGTNASGNPSTYTIESETIVLSNPSRAGYTFKGWKAGSGEPVYSPSIQKASVGNKAFEAVWAANLNAIVFHGNGATSGEMESASGHTDEKIVLPENGFAKTGYHFTGWAKSASGAVVVADQAEMTVGSDSVIDLYAVWTPNTNTITFHSNSGSGTMSNQSMNTDAKGALKANAYTKEGYHFTGWATSQSGAASYADGGSYTMGTESNYDLYATWAPNVYAVTLDANGGSCDEETKVTFDADYSLPVPSRSGYYFAGWYHGDDQLTDANGAALGKYAIAGAITAVAHWTAKLNVVLLTDGNQTVQVKGNSDTYVRLPKNTFEKGGKYLFDGWSSVENGDAEFLDKDLYYVGTKSSYTLHAVFGDYSNVEILSSKEDLLAINNSADNFAKDYVLARDIDMNGTTWGGLGGTFSSGIGVFTGRFDGRGHSIRNFTFYQAYPTVGTKYDFVEYSGGGGGPIYVNRSYCFGLFKKNQGTISNLSISDVNVSLDGFVTSPSSTSSSYHYSWAINVGLIAGVNEGTISNCHVNYEGSLSFSQVGYYYVGGIVGYNDGSISHCSSNLMASLSGTIDSYKGNYSPNYSYYVYSILALGGICGLAVSGPSDCECYFELEKDNLLYGNYGCRGYFGAITGSSSHSSTPRCYYYTTGEFTGLGSSQTNYAEAVDNLGGLSRHNKIIYVGNGKTRIVSYCSKEQKPQPLTGFYKDGYSLAGWSLTDGGSLVYELDEEIGLSPFSSSLVLYAVWQKNTNNISFNGNGSETGEMNSITGKTDDPLALPLCQFAKGGYHFAGWARCSDGEVEYGDGETITVPTDSVTILYAIWQPNSNTIVFHANGGSGTMSSQTGLTNSSFALNACDFEAPDGYWFAGWALSPDGEPVFADGASFTMTTASTYHLYAVWKPIE